MLDQICTTIFGSNDVPCPSTSLPTYSIGTCLDVRDASFVLPFAYFVADDLPITPAEFTFFVHFSGLANPTAHPK